MLHLALARGFDAPHLAGHLGLRRQRRRHPGGRRRRRHLAQSGARRALSLVMTLFGVAVLFIEQEADFLAAVQIIVYAGAIVVLFLFVIMFLGVDRREDVNVEPLAGQRTLAFLMLGITLAGVIAMLATSHWVTGAHQVVGPIQGPITKSAGAPSGEVAQLGKQLFTTYLFAFEATAALLVIAVVGAVVLARRPAASESELAGRVAARGQMDPARHCDRDPCGRGGAGGVGRIGDGRSGIERMGSSS